MTDSSNTEVPPATTPGPVQEASKRRWVTPLVGGLAVVAALVVGGIGGYAVANAMDAGGRPGIHQALQGHVPPAGPDARPDDRRGPGPGDRPGDRPERPHDDADAPNDTEGSQG